MYVIEVEPAFPDWPNTLINIINSHILSLFQPTYSTQPWAEINFPPQKKKKKANDFYYYYYYFIHTLFSPSISICESIPSSCESGLVPWQGNFCPAQHSFESTALREQSSFHYFSAPLPSLWMLMQTRGASWGVLKTEAPEQIVSTTVKQERT